MSWVDVVEQTIADEYVVLAQCFQASDWGLDRYRALWLESVAQEVAPALADPTGATPLPAPFDRLVREYWREEGSASSAPARGQGGWRSEVVAFVARVGAL